jgi:hypothetical protein
MFYNKEHLKATLQIKSISSFKYNNNKYSAYQAKDKKTLLVKCFDTDTTLPYSAWLSNIYSGYYNEQEEPTTSLKSVEIVEPNPIDPFTYFSHVTDSIIDDEFINSMGIPAFKKDYKKHPNIKRFDYTAWSEENSAYSYIQGVHDVLMTTFDESVNIRYKKGKWQNITGGKNTGAFFPSVNEKCSTLLLCEGLKDGINSDIGFNDVDILVTDGKNQPFLFNAYDVNLEKYKMIFFVDDRDVKNEEVIKLFEEMDKEHYEKVKMFDWSLFKEPMKDISNILKAIYEKDTNSFLSEELVKLIGALETKSQIKRKVLPILKKATRQKSFVTIHNDHLEKKLTAQTEHAIKTKNMNMLNYVIKQKHHNDFNLDFEAKYLISKPLHSTNEFNIELKKYLSDFAPTIIKKITENHITLLDSPTNTGKSTLVKTELVKSFKNIIYVAPLRTVVDEFCRGSSFTNVSQKGQNINATLADLNALFVGMTTDIFFNLLKSFPSEMKQRLSDVDLIVFDEQHLIKESENFREKVTEVNKYLLNNHSGKVLFMSGTPHIDSSKISIIKATVPKENRDDIYYQDNPFENEEEFIKNVIKEVKKHSVMIYCSSTLKVTEVTDVLRATDTDCFSITSDGILWNKEIVKSKSLDPRKQIKKWSETCVYICTTRATTGLNLPNLKGIYQYGTIFNSNTFIQLMARERSGGFYYYITPFMERNILDSMEQRAIGISKKFQSLGVDKLSAHWHKEALQRYLVENLSLAVEKRNLDGFLSVYSEELKIIEAYGLGNATIENDDYVFNLDSKNVSEILKGIDTTIERKYIDRILIDYLCKNNISLLNEIYNLSFTIHDATIKKNDVELRLITEEGKEAKKAKRAESRELNKERKEKVVKKLGAYFSFNQLNKEFNSGELDRLLESEVIDFEKLKKANESKQPRDKIVILRTALIPIKNIVKITVDALLSSDDIFTTKDLDLLIQEAYPTKKRNKHPYAPFLKVLYSSVYKGKELQFDNMLVVKDKVKRNKKQFYDVLRFKEDFDPKTTKEFIKQESERLEKVRLDELSERATKKYGFEVVYES